MTISKSQQKRILIQTGQSPLEALREALKGTKPEAAPRLPDTDAWLAKVIAAQKARAERGK